MATGDRRLDVQTLANLTQDLFQSGRRTVSFLDFVEAYQRQYDSNFAQRVVGLLPEVVTELEARGVTCLLVDEFCLRHFGEKAVTTIAEARRCNTLNSGGKPGVGIRRALPDDLVRAEVNGTKAHLNVGGLRHIVQDSVNDVADGVSPPESHDRLVTTLRTELPRIAEASPEPRQRQLDEHDEGA